MERTTSMSFKLVNVSHRHCVFTIAQNLRDFFLQDRALLNCLFHAVNSVISRMFFKMNKSKNFTPGFIMILHTFDRDLKWNPHIPEKHFKMIRYGGLCARHRKTDAKLFRVISKNKHRIYRSFYQWRTAILSSFGYDPLECPHCKHKMEFLELYYNHKRVSLEELYEKAMSKFLGKRSSS